MYVQKPAPTLNPDQQNAVEYGDGPLIVLAGAGTGKTRVLVDRIARLVRKGTPPNRILAVTFTNKAASEMRDRLEYTLAASARSMWIGTFHGICARLLREMGEHIGVGRDFSIFDDDDQSRLLNALLKEHKLDDAASPRTLVTWIGTAKNRGRDPVDTATNSYAEQILRTIYPEYERRLSQENALDFNDLLLKVRDLGQHPHVGQELAGRFDHVLVDEFQDTNLVQYQLVQQFVRHHQNITVVGDDDQSIYSWRGAEPRNLLDFDRDFPDANIVKLEQNYRSSGAILTAANAVIAKNINRRGKDLWTDRDDGDPLLWEEVETEREEADFIARAIAGLVEQDGCEWGDVSVLYRTHAQSRIIEEQLRRYSIDYRVVGGVSFFQRREVKDIRGYLRLVLNSAADSSFERIVNVPSRGLGKTTVNRVKAHARIAQMSYMDAARSCAHGAVASVGSTARKRLGAFVDIIDSLRSVQVGGASVSELIIQAVERSGYRERLEIEDSPDSRDRLANLAEVVTMASDFDEETEGKGSLIEFEERISLSSANDVEGGKGASVTLSTIHAAKGLEFPIVFLCGLEDGLFPSLRDREDGHGAEAGIEEERRLAYVAMTRAENRLILSSARTRRQWGEVRFNEPSRFLHDIPSECLSVRTRPRRDTNPSWKRRAKSAPQYDEYDQRTSYDSEPIYSPEEPIIDGAYQLGDEVRHASFGVGRIIEARGAGQDCKLLIDFQAVGLKTILSRFVEPR